MQVGLMLRGGYRAVTFTNTPLLHGFDAFLFFVEAISVLHLVADNILYAAHVLPGG